MPMMPFIGVRISWLMLARNSLLARLASLAMRVGLRERARALAHLAIEIGGQLLQVLVQEFLLFEGLRQLLIGISQPALHPFDILMEVGNLGEGRV